MVSMTTAIDADSVLLTGEVICLPLCSHTILYQYINRARDLLHNYTAHPCLPFGSIAHKLPKTHPCHTHSGISTHFDTYSFHRHPILSYPQAPFVVDAQSHINTGTHEKGAYVFLYLQAQDHTRSNQTELSRFSYLSVTHAGAGHAFHTSSLATCLLRTTLTVASVCVTE